MDGQDAAKNLIKVWAQNVGSAGTTPNRYRLHRITAQKVGGSTGITNPDFAVSFGIGVFSGTANAADLDKYHHILDCSFSDNDYVSASKTGGTGFYSQGSYYLMEYTRTNNNFGDGYKIFDAEGVGGYAAYTTCNNNIVRFHRSDGNDKYGGINSSGTDNVIHSGIYSNAVNISTGSGIMIGYGGINALVYNNICYGNASGGISIEVDFGPSNITGAKVLNNTCYDNKWNYQVVGSLRTVVTPLFQNNSAYLATTADFRNTATSTPTFTTNHETATTGFGAFFGDPLFVAIGSVFLINSVSSPLYQNGTNPTAYLTEDFSRRPVPQQAAYEIGAYAYPSPFTGLPDNQIEGMYATSVNIALNLTLSVIHPTGDISGSITTEAGVWLKTDDPTNVSIS